MSDHDQVAVETRTMIGIEKRRTVPRFWNGEFENVRSECSRVALIFPQIITSEICEYEHCGNSRDDYKRPVLSKSANDVRPFHQSAISGALENICENDFVRLNQRGQRGDNRRNKNS